MTKLVDEQTMNKQRNAETNSRRAPSAPHAAHVKVTCRNAHHVGVQNLTLREIM